MCGQFEELKGKTFSFNDSGDNGESKSRSKSRSKSNSKSKKDEEEKLPEDYIQKYSGVSIIAESILIGNIPYFLVCENRTIEIKKQIDFGDRILKPYEPTSYINRAYSFTSQEETLQYITDAKDEKLDTLYSKVKRIWKKYIDADDFHISICAADTIFTYFQDIIGLTHYLFFVGNTACGKSNNLTLFNFLAYRNMQSTDLTYANIYQFLGSDQEGIGTICEDEADGIDEDRIKMSIYKNGYTTGKPVFRMLEGLGSGRRQTRLNTFCFKAFAAERLPDSMKAKGFKERVIELHCTYGFPDHDITEVVNPAGEEKFQTLLDELNQVRNMLLIYRLSHYRDIYPDIKINLQNREKQLFKPLLRIFQNTDTFNELRPVLSQFVGNKRRANADTLNAFLYHMLTELVVSTNSYELASNDIIDYIKDVLRCEDIPNKPLSFESSEFGILSQKEIFSILKDVFGAAKPSHHGNNNKWIFNKDRLAKLGRIYQLSPDIKVGVDGDDGVDHMDIGLDKHFQEIEESSDSDSKQPNNYEEFDKKDKEITKQESGNTGPFPNNPPHLSHLSQIEREIIGEKPAEKPEKCPNCDKMIEPFDRNTHPACCTGRKGRKESDTQ